MPVHSAYVNIIYCLASLWPLPFPFNCLDSKIILYFCLLAKVWLNVSRVGNHCCSNLKIHMKSCRQIIICRYRYVWMKWTKINWKKFFVHEIICLIKRVIEHVICVAGRISLLAAAKYVKTQWNLNYLFNQIVSPKSASCCKGSWSWVNLRFRVA